MITAAVHALPNSPPAAVRAGAEEPKFNHSRSKAELGGARFLSRRPAQRRRPPLRDLELAGLNHADLRLIGDLLLQVLADLDVRYRSGV